MFRYAIIYFHCVLISLFFFFTSEKHPFEEENKTSEVSNNVYMIILMDCCVEIANKVCQKNLLKG